MGMPALKRCLWNLRSTDPSFFNEPFSCTGTRFGMHRVGCEWLVFYTDGYRYTHAIKVYTKMNLTLFTEESAIYIFTMPTSNFVGDRRRLKTKKRERTAWKCGRLARLGSSREGATQALFHIQRNSREWNANDEKIQAKGARKSEGNMRGWIFSHKGLL